MALTGYDPNIVNTSVNSVVSAYNELMAQIKDQIQNKFVNGMADKWACVNAVNFFNEGFKPTIDELLNSTNQIFDSVVRSMTDAATAWANDTGSTQIVVANFSQQNPSIDVSNIQENIGGVRGIDLEQSTSVINQLPSIAIQAESALEHAKSAVQDCGFIGGNQASNLINSLATIKTKINNAFLDITDNVKNAMEQTVNTYSDTEGRISQAFQAE